MTPLSSMQVTRSCPHNLAVACRGPTLETTSPKQLTSSPAPLRAHQRRTRKESARDWVVRHSQSSRRRMRRVGSQPEPSLFHPRSAERTVSRSRQLTTAAHGVSGDDGLHYSGIPSGTAPVVVGVPTSLTAANAPERDTSKTPFTTSL